MCPLQKINEHAFKFISCLVQKGKHFKCAREEMHCPLIKLKYVVSPFGFIEMFHITLEWMFQPTIHLIFCAFQPQSWTTKPFWMVPVGVLKGKHQISFSSSAPSILVGVGLSSLSLKFTFYLSLKTVEWFTESKCYNNSLNFKLF